MDIKGFVFSVTVVLMLVVGSTSLFFVPMDDYLLVGDVAALPPPAANDAETLWLDAYSTSDPITYSQNPLKDGEEYKITIEGTFSAWESWAWNDEDDPPVGAVEAAPMYMGLGGEQTGPVGTDPYWGFACPFGQDYADTIHAYTMPWHWDFLISLDDGASWRGIRPINNVYNPMHKYEAEVVGTGTLIGFRIFDTGSTNNYGMLKIVITPDTDGDGLYDDWEQEGIDFNQDGGVDLDLPTLGADWQHKDIFVEVDYMQGHKPMDAAMADVKAAFSRAPNALVDNPDKKDGVNLHILVDEQTIHQDILYVWEGFDSMKSSYFGSFDQRTASNSADILKAMKLSFRYCLFINQFARYNNKTSSYEPRNAAGVSEVPGNDFIVALGTFDTHGGTRDEQAAVFMHELGHTLNLRHGGDVNENYKPNYLSIMNYLFIFDEDPVPNRPLDYSRSALPTINENALDEMKGVSPNAYEPSYHANWVMTAYSDASGQPISSSLDAIDWNNDSSFNSSVSADINNFVCWDWSSGEKTTLTGYEDWSHLLYNFKKTAEYADGMHQPVMDEITSDMVELMSEYRFEVLPTPNDDGGGDNTMLYVGIGAIAILAVAGAAFVMMRRKK